MPNPIEKSFSAGRKPPTANDHLRREQIGVRANEIYLERGGSHGHDLDDWQQAERELFEKYQNTGRMAKAVV